MALVNILVPESQPDAQMLCSTSALQNIQSALDAASTHLKVPRYLSASTIQELGQNTELDKCFLTYLSHFITPMKNTVLEWVAKKLSGSFETINFSSVFWEDGKALLALVEACRPGACPQWGELDSNDKESNVTMAFDIVKVQWSLTPTFEARELARETVEESKLVIFLAGIKHACSCQTIQKKIEQYYKVGDSIPLTHPIKSSSETVQAIVATVAKIKGDVTSQTQPLDVKYNTATKQAYVQLQLEDIGLYNIAIEHAPKTLPSLNIPQFQFLVRSVDPSKCHVSQALPSTLVLNREYELQVVATQAGPGILNCFVQPSGSLSAVPGQSEADVSSERNMHFKACKVGKASISLQWGPYRITQQPVQVNVVDPLRCTFTCSQMQHQRDNKLQVGVPVQIKVNCTSGGAACTPVVAVTNAEKTVPVTTAVSNQANAEEFTATFTPCEIGECAMSVEVEGAHIHGSPKRFWVIDEEAEDVDIPKETDNSHEEEIFHEAVDDLTSEQLKVTGISENAEFINKPVTFHITANKPGLLENGDLTVEIKNIDVAQRDTNIATRFDSTDEGDGRYSITYKVGREGKYKITICYKEEHVSQSPYTVHFVSRASKCRAFGETMAQSKPTIVGKVLRLFVDSTEAGDGEMTVSIIDEGGETVKETVTYLKEKLQHLIEFTPEKVGTYIVSVEWDGITIPNSPFWFKASYPGNVQIEGLPSNEDYVLVIPNTLSFTIDTSTAGEGELQAIAQLEDGTEEPIRLDEVEFCKTLATYTPSRKGEMNLGLTFLGVRVLKRPWGCDIIDPNSVSMTTPTTKCAIGERYVINFSGLSEHEVKYLTVSVTPSVGNSPLIRNFNPNNDSTATATFTPSVVGEYVISAQLAGESIRNSPIEMDAIAPRACKLDRNIPDVIPVGHSVEIQVDTSMAGHGELSSPCDHQEQTSKECVEVVVYGKCVRFRGIAAGRTHVSLKIAGFDILDKPHQLTVIDPQLCTFNCPAIETNNVREGDNITAYIDTSRSYACVPEVKIEDAHKKQVQASITQQDHGKYVATFRPMQLGAGSLKVLVAGVNAKGSPLNFSVEPQTAEILGNFPKTLILGQSATVQIATTKKNEKPKALFSVQGAFYSSVQQDTTTHEQYIYNVTLTAQEVGEHTVHLKVDGCQMKGKPNIISVLDPSKCHMESKFPENMKKGVQHRKEVTIKTTGAGKGELVVVSSDPASLSTQLEATKKDVYKVTLTPHKSTAAPVAVHIEFGRCPLDGSPFTISIYDADKVYFEPSDLPTAYVNKTFDITVHTEGAGQGTLEVLVTDPKMLKTDTIAAEKGRYTVSCTPLQVGSHSLSLQWNGLDIPKSPILISSCDPSKCKVEDVPRDGTYIIQKGLQSSREITIDTKEAGKGEIEAISSEPSRLSTKMEKMDEDHYKLTLTAWEMPTAPVKVGIEFGGIHIPDSPLTANVCDIEQVYVEPAHIPTTRVNEIITITIHTENAGHGCLELQASDPQAIETELVEGGGGVFTASCTPLQVGSHLLSVYWNSMEIPTSPITICACDPTKCKVKGIPENMKKGMDHRKEVTIKTTGAGKGELVAFSSDPASLSTQLVPTKKDVYKVTLTPHKSTAAPVTVHIEFGRCPLDGSPFTINIYDADKVYFEPSELPMAYVNKTFDITVHTEGAGQGTLEALVTAPKMLKTDTTAAEKGMYTVSCTPLQVGSHSLSLQWNGLDIPKSPVLISSCDPSKCKVEDVPKDGTYIIQKGSQSSREITIDTKEAGKGEIEAISSEPSRLSTKMEKMDEDHYKLTLTAWEMPTAPVKVGVEFGGIHIPDSPLTANVCDIEQVYVEPAHIPTTRVNEIITITIHTENAGHGCLELQASDPQAIETELVDGGGGVFTVSCTPLQVGSHLLSVYWNSMEIPTSPITICACDPTKCNVEGVPEDGFTLQKGLQNKKDVTVITEGAGQGKFSAVSSDPSCLPIDIEPMSEDRFKVILIPKEVTKVPVRVDLGYGGAPLRGSPFTVNVCNAEGVYVEPSELPILYVGEPFEMTVHTEEAGEGELEVQAYDANKLNVEVAKSELDAYTVAFTPLQVGSHCVTLLWNDFEVPCSPLVLTACDPSKCIVKGIPKEGHGFTNERLNVSVDFGGAGKGKVTAEVEYDDKSIEKLPVKHENSVASFTIVAVTPPKKAIRVKFNERQIATYKIILEQRDSRQTNRRLCTCVVSFLLILGVLLAIALYLIFDVEHSLANKYV